MKAKTQLIGTSTASPQQSARRQLMPSVAAFDSRTFLSDSAAVTGAELIRRLQKLGRQRGVRVRFRPERGKGSHGTLYYGERLTVVKDRRKELSEGLLTAMLRQIGLTRDDLR